MTILIGWLTKALGEKLAPFIAWIGLALLILGALWWLRHDAYQDGVSATDAKWEEAGRKLEAQAKKAEQSADAESVKRVQENNERLKEEKEKLDEAEAEGSSPFDVLFGS